MPEYESPQLGPKIHMAILLLKCSNASTIIFGRLDCAFTGGDTDSNSVTMV